MNFIQALEALRQGKKVRCKSWPKTLGLRYIYFNPESGLLKDNTGYLAMTCAHLIPNSLDSLEKDEWEIYNPLLTIAERLYLNLLLKSYIDTDRLEYISIESEKIGNHNEFYLACYLKPTDGGEVYEVLDLPYHTYCRDELYRNLEMGRKYTPEELDIKYAPMSSMEEKE